MPQDAGMDTLTSSNKSLFRPLVQTANSIANSTRAANSEREETNPDTIQIGQRTDTNQQMTQNQRVKAFILKQRANGQDVGAKRDSNGTLKAHWNIDPTDKSPNTQVSPEQRKQDAQQFRQGMLDAVSSYAKSQFQNSPGMKKLRYHQDPIGETKKKIQNAKDTFEALTHPKETANQIKAQMKEQYLSLIHI